MLADEWIEVVIVALYTDEHLYLNTKVLMNQLSVLWKVYGSTITESEDDNKVQNM